MPDQELSEWKPRWPLAEGLSRAVDYVDQGLRSTFRDVRHPNDETTPGTVASDFLGLPGLSRTLNRVAYGDRLTEGKNQTLQMLPDTVDAIPYAMGAARPYMKLADKIVKATPHGQLNMFAGIGAKTADLASLDNAHSMVLKGESPEKIWEKTGWFQAPDGVWKFEIDDSKAKFTGLDTRNAARKDSVQKIDAINKAMDIHDLRLQGNDDSDIKRYFIETHGRPPTFQEMSYATNFSPDELWSMSTKHTDNLNSPFRSTTEKFLDHPDLYDAYPNFRSMPTNATGDQDLKGGAIAQFHHRGEIDLHTGVLGQDSVAKTSMLHELQHAIQKGEGFEPGASPQHILNQKNANIREHLDNMRAFHTAKEVRRVMDSNPGMPADVALDKVVRDANHHGTDRDYHPGGRLRDYVTDVATRFDVGQLDAAGKRSEASGKSLPLLSPKDAHALYLRSIGEAEARAVEHRSGLTADERHKQFPLKDYYKNVPPGSTLLKTEDLYNRDWINP